MQTAIDEFGRSRLWKTELRPQQRIQKVQTDLGGGGVTSRGERQRNGDYALAALKG
jgi:hypothetical protein